MARVKGKYTNGGIQFLEGTDVLFEIAQKANGGPKGEVAAYAAAGAVPIRSHVGLITKADGAAALTVAAPTATTHDGVVITLVATTAQAHTITATTIGFNAGDAASDVGTFGGAIGDMISFVAYQGEWYVLNNVNVTLG